VSAAEVTVPTRYARVLSSNATTVTVPALSFGANIAADGACGIATKVLSPTASSGARNAQGFELTYTPPLSIFDYSRALPSGDYELRLTAQSSSVFKTAVVESLSSAKVAGTDFDFSVDAIDFYVCTVEGPRFDDGSYLLDLTEISCQSREVTNASSLSQLSFDVPASTHALTCAYQDINANGSTTLRSQSKFKVQGDDELDLTRMYLQYASQQKPQPDADPAYDATANTNVDRMTQRYIETMLESGLYWNDGGAETLEEYRSMGAIYHFNWPKDSSDSSTRVNVNQQFSSAGNSRNLLLFAHHKTAVKIEVKDGRVTSAEIEQR